MHRILDQHTVPRFEAFLGDVLARIQATAGLDPSRRVLSPMQHISIEDETMVYDTSGAVYDDDLVAGNEYVVGCLVALTGVWVSMSCEGGSVLSWGPVWVADQVKVYDVVMTRPTGRVFFNGKPMFRD